MKIEIYHEEDFCKFAEELKLEHVDLKGFPDLCDHPEPAGRPTAISNLYTKQFFLLLGEEKAGKTWMSLYLAYKLAYDPKNPKLVVYFYGEGEKDELEKRLEIIRQACCKESGATEGEVKMVNLNDRDWNDEGFDLKRKEHQDYFRTKLEEVKQEASYPLEAIILDNYASLMGKTQEGNAAIKLLQFLRQYQRQGLAVLLACHTNRKFEVAGSIQLPRRANGIVRLTRKALWKLEIEQRLDNVAKRSDGPKNDFPQALQKEYEAIVRENNEAEANLTRLTLHVSYQKFRGVEPLPEEIVINIPECTLEAVVVTSEVRNKYAGEYLERLMAKNSSDKGSVGADGEDEDIEEEDFEESEQERKDMTNAPLPYTYEEIKEMPSVEEQVKALRTIVTERCCKTIPELAEVLGVKKNDLKNFMKGRIHNKDIGLQALAGRPKNRVNTIF